MNSKMSRSFKSYALRIVRVALVAILIAAATPIRYGARMRANKTE
jgi:hypothetical protein